jgi:hypothetical protein
MVTINDYLSGKLSDDCVCKIEDIREAFQFGEIDGYEAARELTYYIVEEYRFDWDEAVKLVEKWRTMFDI